MRTAGRRRPTHVSPSSDDVVAVVLADRQADDAPVDGRAAVLGGQFIFSHLDPAQRADGEPHRVGVAVSAAHVVQVTAAPARRLRRTPAARRQTDCEILVPVNMRSRDVL